MATIFWDSQGILLMNWLYTGATSNSDTYHKTLTKLRCRIPQQRKGKWSCKVLLQHDNTQPHISDKKLVRH
jgi:Transposase.